MFQKRRNPNYREPTPSEVGVIRYFGEIQDGEMSRCDPEYHEVFNRLPPEAQGIIFRQLAQATMLLERFGLGDAAEHNDNINQLVSRLFERYRVHDYSS